MLNPPTQLSDVLEPGKEILPGYRLIERIGVGGFGEVWRADAPGGLEKAVKFIQSRIENSHAERELEALERIKRLRHPFLLSTERIEQTEEGLVIVLELAEGNLRERLNDCRHVNRVGIPTEELLGYLSDAADVLDYLWNTESLQHLDIKPENLMLSGKHLKLGDFGLVQQISENQQSLLAGITPAYAAPEVFEGKPTRYSDQYSLAIVFQELLTAQLPFKGRTAAQLAMQHTSQPPQLDSLPIGVRSVVRRALAKDPEQRFSCCINLVAALKEAIQNRSATSVRSLGASDRVSQLLTRVSNHQSAAPQAETDNDLGETSSIVPAVAQTAAVRTAQCNDFAGTLRREGPLLLDSLPVGEGAGSLRPTILVGVGGTGIRSTAEAMRLLSQGSNAIEDELFSVVAIDLDSETVRDAALGRFGFPIEDRDFISVPLRTAHQYRDRGIGRYTSIPKRWIYNVPRALHTEGMRPLGRLAFIDHYEMVEAQLRKVVKEAIEDAQKVSEEKELSVRLDPRVIVVGSISGGTASGMMIDLGYLIQRVLLESKLDTKGVIALLSSGSRSPIVNEELPTANSLAFLAEYEAMRKLPNGYVGDLAARIPALPQAISPYYEAYLFDHSESEGEGYEAGIRNLGQLLKQQVDAKSAELFEQSRADSFWRKTEDVHIRMLDVRHCRVESILDVQNRSKVLCRRLIAEWKGTEKKHKDLPASVRNKIEQWTERTLNTLNGDGIAFCSWLGQEILEKLNTTAQQFTGGCAKRAISNAIQKAAHTPSESMFELLLNEIDQQFNGAMSPDGENSDLSFADLVISICQPMLDEISKQIKSWLSVLIDTANVRVPGAMYASQYCESQWQRGLQVSKQQRQKLVETLDEKRDEVFAELVAFCGPDGSSTPTALAEKLSEYATTRFHDLAYYLTQVVYGRAIERVSAFRELIGRNETRLDALADMFLESENETTDGDEELQAMFGEDLSRLYKLVEELDLIVSEHLFQGDNQLSNIDPKKTEEFEMVATQLASFANQVVSSAARGGAFSFADQASNDESKEDSDEPLPRFLNELTERRPLEGAQQRLILIAPDIQEVEEFREEVTIRFGVEPTWIPCDDAEMILISETLGLGVVQVVKTIANQQERRIGLADRLASRGDL